MIDGDTLECDKLKVRACGIDAPELSQPFGNAATTKLTQLTLNKNVRLVTQGTDILRFSNECGTGISFNKVANDICTFLMSIPLYLVTFFMKTAILTPVAIALLLLLLLAQNHRYFVATLKLLWSCF